MRTPTRRGILATLIAAGTTAVTVLGSTPAYAALPTPIAASTARSYLSSMTVTSEHSRDGYSRDLFPHWINISGNCDTRETILKRDGTGVVTNSSCAATSGSWYSPYDGATWSASSDVDIDHLVPLAEAWDSGAYNWSTSKRQDLANDLTRPQLLAVTDNVNQSKGDQDPHLVALPHRLPLHIRPRLGPGQTPLRTHSRLRRKERPLLHPQRLLTAKRQLTSASGSYSHTRTPELRRGGAAVNLTV